MSNILGTSKGYTGSLEYDDRSETLWGKLLFIRDLITYESLDGSVQSLKEQFNLAIDEYLADCQEEGVDPDRPAKGSFNVRITPKLHLDVLLYTKRNDTSLNSFVAAAIEEKLNDNSLHIHHHIKTQFYKPPSEISSQALKGIAEKYTKTSSNKALANNKGSSEWAQISH